MVAPPGGVGVPGGTPPEAAGAAAPDEEGGVGPLPLGMRLKLLSPILMSSSRVERSSKQSWTLGPLGSEAIRGELTASAMDEGLQLLSAGC